MIIFPVSILGNLELIVPGKIFFGIIIVNEADNRFSAGDQQRWVKALVKVIFEVTHLPLVTTPQPFFDLWGFFAQEFRLRNTTKTEAKFLGSRFDELGSL